MAVEVTKEASNDTHTSLAGAKFSFSAAIWVLCSLNWVCIDSTDPLMSLTELTGEIINVVRASVLAKDDPLCAPVREVLVVGEVSTVAASSHFWQG